MASTGTADRTLRAVREAARRLPDVEEGISCEGTPLERRTFKTKKKAFVFFGKKDGAVDVMLKLAASIPEAKKLGFEAGANGWTKCVFAEGEAPPKGVLDRFITESHALMSGDAPAAKRTKTAPKARTKAKTATKRHARPR